MLASENTLPCDPPRPFRFLNIHMDVSEFIHVDQQVVLKFLLAIIITLELNEYDFFFIIIK